MNSYVFSLNTRPFKAIKEDKKKVEYRVNTEFDGIDYSQINIGDELIFFSDDNEGRIIAQVMRISHYPDAYSMYKEEGLENSSSNPKSIEEAVKRIHKYTGYDEGIKTGGIYAIEFEIVRSLTTQRIIYQEFGVKTEILKYKRIGPKLKGMREGKPFVSGNQVRVNVGENLCLAEESKFYDLEGNELERKDVCLDTDHRVAGIIINSSNRILLLKLNRSNHFYSFPGGHQRECESVETCLQREMEEETGIDIKSSDTSLLLEMHQEGFGPESFYLIDIGAKDIKFIKEDPDDKTSELGVHKFNKIQELDNLLPIEVADKLKLTLIDRSKGK